MRRLIFLNRFFFPDHSATSQILSDLAFFLAASGNEVHVVTSRQRYDDPAADLPAHEVVRGVTIHRVATTRFGRSNLVGRAADYFSFYLALWRKVRELARAGDVVIAKTDPPLASIPAMYAAAARRAHLVNWLQDLYPEVAVELGVTQIPLRGVLTRIRDRSLAVAAANVAVGELMAQRIIALGAAADRVHVIPNWCDDEAIRPVPPADNPLRREWGLDGKFVVGYSGNLGRAHEFETVLQAAELLKARSDIVFLFIGGGYLLDRLVKRVEERRLGAMFRFLPYQDSGVLAASLGAADAHWISLRPAVEGLIVPSKFYGIAASGRPIIAVAARTGEIARLVEQHRCGGVVEPGDGEGFAHAVVRMAEDKAVCLAMGARARAMLEAGFTRRQALERWKSLFQHLG